jgi:hypothetical protein
MRDTASPTNISLPMPPLVGHRTIASGIGHNLLQEAPQTFAEAIVDIAELDERNAQSMDEQTSGTSVSGQPLNP